MGTPIQTEFSHSWQEGMVSALQATQTSSFPGAQGVGCLHLTVPSSGSTPTPWHRGFAIGGNWFRSRDLFSLDLQDQNLCGWSSGPCSQPVNFAASLCLRGPRAWSHLVSLWLRLVRGGGAGRAADLCPTQASGGPAPAQTSGVTQQGTFCQVEGVRTIIFILLTDRDTSSPRAQAD